MSYMRWVSALESLHIVSWVVGQVTQHVISLFPDQGLNLPTVEVLWCPSNWTAREVPSEGVSNPS